MIDIDPVEIGGETTGEALRAPFPWEEDLAVSLASRIWSGPGSGMSIHTTNHSPGHWLCCSGGHRRRGLKP